MERLKAEGDANRAKAIAERAKYVAQAKAFITGMDKNKNGSLSTDEVPGAMKSFLPQFDSDRDGEISAEEAGVFIRQMSGGRRSSKKAE